MNKRISTNVLLLFCILSFVPHNLVAVRTHQTQETKKENQKPTIEQSLGKLFRFCWSKFTKDDAANLAKIGLTVGGIYMLFRYTDVFEGMFNYRNISPDNMYVVQQNTGTGVQQSAAWLDQQENEERNCATCWNNFRLANRYQLACGHNNYCGDCLCRHIRAQASEANITHIRCPHVDANDSPDCNHMFTSQEMINIANGDRRILDDARQAIINGPRNQALRTVHNVRACHLCPALFVYRGRRVINCPGCHTVYCARCRGNHSGNVRTCANRDQTVIKRCARCGSEVQKNGGCNHMTCTQCQYNYCWTCLGPHNQNGCNSFRCGALNPIRRVPRAQRFVFRW